MKLADALQSQVGELLKTSDACISSGLLGKDGRNAGESLNGLYAKYIASIGTITEQKVHFSTGNIFSHGHVVGNPSVRSDPLLKLDSITIQYAEDVTHKGPGATLPANVKLLFSKIKPTVGGPLIQRTIRITTQIDGAKKIQDCAIHSDGLEEFCESALGGQMEVDRCHSMTLRRVKTGPLVLGPKLNSGSSSRWRIDEDLMVGDFKGSIPDWSDVNFLTTNGDIKVNTLRLYYGPKAQKIIVEESGILSNPNFKPERICELDGNDPCGKCLKAGDWAGKKCNANERVVSYSRGGEMICKEWGQAL